jgi:hypothetical protein
MVILLELALTEPAASDRRNPPELARLVGFIDAPSSKLA